MSIRNHTNLSPTAPYNAPTDSAETAQSEAPSFWLYLAGFCVTMSGLFAVNFSLNNPGFTMLTYGLAFCGYITSYILRRRNLALSAVQTPLLVGLALIFLAAISSGQGFDWLLPVEDPNDRAKALQLIFAWFAILHTFTLSADAAVLFACVPCMTMIALASTQGTDTELLNSFLVFVGASTFLMIHENYLRTKQGKVLGRTAAGERRLFGGQVQLAAFCVIAALMLANFVAVPIRQVGQSLSLVGSLPTPNSPSSQQRRLQSLAVQVNEQNELVISDGPDIESETPLLQVRSPRGMNMRGTTFDEYTGRTFKNNFQEETLIAPRMGYAESREQYRDYVDIMQAGRANGQRFDLPVSPVELPDEQMQDSTLVEQIVRVVGGRQSNIYAGGRVKAIRADLRGPLYATSAGAIRSNEGIGLDRNYYVISQVPSEEEGLLRAVSALPVPDSIRQRYLQVATPAGAENARLRALAQQFTTGITNTYDKVKAIEDAIAQTCKYNLQAERAPGDQDIVEYFLTASKEGDCKSFAAAMVVLCRYAGIPARLASGFLPGEFRPQENHYLIRQKDKHVWTEVFFPTVGWIGFDATANAEDISDHSSGSANKRQGFFAWFFAQGGTTILVGIFCLLLIAYVFKTEIWDKLAGRSRSRPETLVKPATNLAIIAAYVETNRALGKRGIHRPAHLTPLEFARHVSELHTETLPEIASPLNTLTLLFTRFRYSEEAATAEEVRLAQEASASLRQILQESKRRVIHRIPAQSPT